MSSITDIHKLLELFGYASQRFSDWEKKVSVQERQKNELARNEALSKMARSGAYLRFGVEYYGKQALPDNAFFHSVHLHGTRIETGTLTKREWLQINHPLSPASEEIVEGFPDRDVEHNDLAWEVATRIFAPKDGNNRSGEQFWNDPIYKLNAIRLENGKPRLKFGLTDFFHHRFGNGLLEDELIKAFCTSSYDVAGICHQSKELLPLREKRLPSVESLLAFEKRTCVGGIALVTALARPKPYSDYFIIIQRRSSKVSDRRQLLTVMPKGYHQHSCHKHEESCLYWTAMREIYEELFGGEERLAQKRGFAHDFYMREEPMSWFVKHPDKFDLGCTGFGIDPITGNYNFSLLLVIKDQNQLHKIYDRMVPHSWESSANVHESISSRDTKQIERMLLDKSWAGESLFALLQALNILKEKDPSRVNLPSILLDQKP